MIQMEMPKYIPRKTVYALKIKKIEIEVGRTIITPEEDGYAPFEVDPEKVLGLGKAGEYYVIDERGRSICYSANAFEFEYAKI